MLTTTLLQVAASRAGAFSAPGLVTIETSPPRHGTLIAPDLVAVASHYIPPLGVAVTALTSEGERTSVIASVAMRQADVTVLRLKYPLEKASIASVATEADVRAMRSPFVGVGWRNIATPSQEPVAANLTLSLIQTDSADSTRRAKIALFKAGAMQPVIQDGDSGSPVYVQTGNGWKLAGVWHGKSTSFNPASLLFPWADAIRALSQ